MSPARKPRFQTAAGLTLPSADEAVGASTPGRQDVVTPERLGAETPDKQRRSAFTWRLTSQEAARLDMMIARLKLELDRPKVDRAQLLAALVAVADKNPAIFATVVAEMQNE